MIALVPTWCAGLASGISNAATFACLNSGALLAFAAAHQLAKGNYMLLKVYGRRCTLCHFVCASRELVFQRGAGSRKCRTTARGVQLRRQNVFSERLLKLGAWQRTSDGSCVSTGCGQNGDTSRFAAHAGDGAGILCAMPESFLIRATSELGIHLPPRNYYGVGMAFLPQDASVRSQVKELMDTVRSSLPLCAAPLQCCGATVYCACRSCFVLCF